MSARQSSSKPASSVEPAKKSTVSKKSVAAVVEAAVVAAPAPAPVAEVQVVAPAPAAAPVKVSRSRAKPAATVEVQVAAPAPVPEPVSVAAESAPAEVATADESGEQAAVKARRVRARPRNRAFSELHSEMSADLTNAYKSLQNVVRGFSSLSNAHKREVSSTVHRESANRTPSALFDQRLVSYFLSRIPAERLRNITRKNGTTETTVDLSGLTSSTRVFRTDMTKLYTMAVDCHGCTDPADHRVILYQKDPELVALLTTGNYNHEYEAEVQQIRDGTFKLNIFNIQRFLGHLVSKAPAEVEETA